MREARQRAVSGLGPTLIEAVTYRFGPHTTADDPTKYRNDAELEEWKSRDPLLRLQHYLRGKNLWSEEEEAQIKADAEAVISQSVQEAENYPAPPPEDIFQYTYARLTPSLQEQMEEYLSFFKAKEK
jgi:pyruvate dehydrogenase E1 component alpha subunit